MLQQNNPASFGLQTRLFVVLKRNGRIIDLVWFQQDAGYACHVLELAAASADDEARELSGRLHDSLADYLATAKRGPMAVERGEPEAKAATEAAVEEVPVERYVMSLR